MATSNEDLFREFLLETQENLTSLDSDLIALEKNPGDTRTLAQVFRTLHSVKGTAGFMGLEKLQTLAHSAENLLSRLRAGELSFDSAIATALLRTVDAIREMLGRIESSGAEGADEYAELIAELDRLRVSEGRASASAVGPPSPVPTPPLADDIQHVEAGEASSATSKFATIADAAAGSASPSDGSSGEYVEARIPQVADSSIRVDVGLLDDLMTSVGELVLARNQIMQYSAAHADEEFLGTVQRLDRLTTELQASVMKTRMQPVGSLFANFPRVVRDLSLACGKKVRLEIEGQETELDKTLIEAIRDPLTHMVRNAVDHGIESPEERRLAGKPEEGRLRVAARHVGGRVVVEIADDGAGIRADRVREKAAAAKLISSEAASALSRQEALRLIFMPGFSTSDRVTQYSGRGVGMDVVRTNVEKIGGRVDIDSVEGAGTAIRATIPLTLTIIPALIVVSGSERFAIPQASVLELVGIERDGESHGIERVQGVPVFRLRDALLPIVFLDRQLNLPGRRESAPGTTIVVLQTDDRPFGLVVDSVRDTEEIVVKPLQRQIKSIRSFAGAAIMGDGRVALVIDVPGLAQRAKVVSAPIGRAASDAESLADEPGPRAEPTLCFELGDGTRMSLPLSRVSRLEEFSSTAIERVGAGRAVQYRGGILPLVDVSAELARLAERRFEPQDGKNSRTQASTNADVEPVRVVVCEVGARHVGLVVANVVDIVHEPIATSVCGSRPGVAFSAVLQDRITEFLDVDVVVRDALADYSLPRAQESVPR